MFITMIQVALGGAIGAAARFAFGVGVMRAFGITVIPLGVIGVNILGSFLMGALIVVLAHKTAAHLNPFLATGVLGGFTTFSSFSLEAARLMERGDLGTAALYVALSVVLGLLAFFAGAWLARGMIA
jgi:CrcB protein